METLKYGSLTYEVDHAVLIADYHFPGGVGKIRHSIHGYDSSNRLIVALDDIADMSKVEYSGDLMNSSSCFEEPCNIVRYVGGELVTGDRAPVPLNIITVFLVERSVDSDGNVTYTPDWFDFDVAQSTLELSGTVICRVYDEGQQYPYSNFMEYMLSEFIADDGHCVFVNAVSRTVLSVDLGADDICEFSEGVIPGGGAGGGDVTIDTTLSIRGAAADAAAVGDALGDISAALDNIIAIQEELTGSSGATIIRFSLWGVECEAVEGMNWDEWIHSEYNTIGVYVNPEGYEYEGVTCVDYVADQAGDPVVLDGVIQYDHVEIVAGAEYDTL